MIPTMILFGLVLGRRLRPLPSRHRRLSAGRRPGHTAVDGVRHRQAFHALRADRKAEIPANLLYLRLPTAFAVSYWRRVLAGPRGELWFAAHTRAAPEEMRALADELQAAVRRTGRSTPDLTMLLRTSP